MAESVIILGSPRKDGNTKQISDIIALQTNSQVINLYDKLINYYEYDDTQREDDFISIIEEILKYKVIIFATPVYWYSMSAQLKTFFDRLSDIVSIRKDLGRAMKGKSVFLISCSASSNESIGFTYPFSETSRYLDMDFIDYLHVWTRDGEFSSELSPKIDKFVKKVLEISKK